MIREALDAYARATARVFEDRANTVGASEIGQCARKVFFSKNEGDFLVGKPRDVDHVESWGAARRGRLFEDYVWEPALRARLGDKLLFAGKQQQTFSDQYLSATPDGLITGLPSDALSALGVPSIGDNASVVVEAKTIDPRARLDEPRPEHAYQVQVQLGLLRQSTPHQPDYAVITYANASFLDDVAEFAVRFDPAIFATAKGRAAQIMTASSPAELKPEGWIAGGRECEFCAFSAACGRLRHAVPTDGRANPEPDPQLIAELADLARAAKQHRTSMESATAELRAVEHEIRERMRDRGLRRVAGDGVVITWASVKGRSSLDQVALKQAAEKAGVDLNQFVKSGDLTDRLTITIRGPAPAEPEMKQKQPKEKLA